MRRKGGQAVQFRQSGSLMVVLYSIFFQILHQTLWFPIPAHFHSNILELSVPYASSWYRLKIKFFYIHSFVFVICAVFFVWLFYVPTWLGHEVPRHLVKQNSRYVLFGMRLTFELENWLKQIAVFNVDEPHPIDWRTELNRKPE